MSRKGGSGTSSTDYVQYTITDDNLPALIPSASPVASVEKPEGNVISFVENFDEPKFGMKDNYDTIDADVQRTDSLCEWRG